MVSTPAALAPPALGARVKDYGRTAGRVWQIIVVIGLSAAMAATCWLPAVFEAHGTLSTRLGLGLGLLGLFVAVPMVVGVYQLARLDRVSLSLFENGLVYRRRGQALATTWDEIEACVIDPDNGAVRLTQSGGQVIEFGFGLDGVGEVAETIQAQTLPRQLPQVQAAIAHGANVPFPGLKPFGQQRPGRPLNNFAWASAGFSAEARGLTALDGGQPMAWSAVTAYGVRTEQMGRIPVTVLFVEANEIRWQTRYGLLSNAQILLALCAEMTGLDPTLPDD